jgi:hypothetical protein
MAYSPCVTRTLAKQQSTGDRLLPVEWLLLSRWDHDSGAIKYCVEYLDMESESVRASPREA